MIDIAVAVKEVASKAAEKVKENSSNIEKIKETGLDEIIEKIAQNADTETAKTTPLSALVESAKEQRDGDDKTTSDMNEGKEGKEGHEGLSDEQKEKLRELTGWSDEIIDAIGSWEEAEIYMKANLKEVEINGKKCLIRDDIDWDQKDAEGRTNKERVGLKPPEGPLVPLNKNGERIELHHIGQHSDSPFAELTMKEHRSKGNNTILHDPMKEKSEIDRQKFATERSQHWQNRANEGVD